MKLSILMPVYNEEVRVADAVKQALDVDYPTETELVIVDDGSRDRTAEILNGLHDERLRVVLAKALGNVDLGALIAGAGSKGSSSENLEEWLRNEFFEQHCALFHHRPFIWHVWDGHKTGFSALVNYHRLTHANLEKLTYAYLGDWIRRQQAAVEADEAGSDARLQAAKHRLAAGEAAAQVAAAVGLADQAHLTRAFRQRYGTTPARYAQQAGTRPRPA